MRTQLRRKTESRRLRRRGHVAPDRPELDEPERRVRDAGGPEDTETHACGCGYVFEAAVSTSVACPHCGSSQAW